MISNADYQISIGTTADLKAADDTIAAFEKQIAKAKVTGQAFEELEQKMGRLKAAAAAYRAEQAGTGPDKVEQEFKSILDNARGVGQEAEKAGEGFKVLGHGAHEAHSILHVLNQMFPGVQQLARFLATGMTAAIGLALVAFEYFKSKIEAVDKALDDLNVTSARSDYIDKLRDQSNEASISFNTWQHQVERNAMALESLKDRTDAFITAQKAMIDAQEELRQSDDGLASAQIELREKLGQITHEQAIKLKLELDESGFKAELDAKIAALQAEIAAKTREQAEASGSLGQLGQNVTTAKAAKDAADAAKTRNDANLEKAKQDLDNTQKAEDDNQKRIEELEAKQRNFFGRLDRGDTWELKTRQEKSEENQRTMAGYRKLIAQDQTKVVPLGTAASTANDDFEEAKKKYAEAAGQAHDLGLELQKLRDKLAGQEASNASLQASHNAGLETRANTQIFEEWQRIKKAVESGNASPSDLQQWNAFQEDIRKHRANPGERQVWNDLNDSERAPQDRAAQEKWSNTPGPQIGLDISNARGAVAAAKNAVARGQGSDTDLSDFLNEVIGLTQDIHANAAQKAELSKMADEIKTLRRQVGQQNWRMNNSSFPS